MECPYCHKPMQKGYINGDRYPLKWVEESKNKDPVLNFFTKGIKLTKYFEGNSIESEYCSDCKKIIISLNKIS